VTLKRASLIHANEFILFRETNSDPGEFIHELNDPDLLRMRSLSPPASVQLRREQVARLERNIELLRAKQVEFNRKMDEYIVNLARLIESLEKGIAADESRCPGEPHRGTHVRCLRCQAQRTFRRLEIIVARESDDSLTSPTECYVSEMGKLKKGVFYCLSCGSEALVIRSA
jgi:hypothetical protein